MHTAACLEAKLGDGRHELCRCDAVVRDLRDKLAQAEDDIDILQSWHYNRTRHEERGCQCEGECVLEDRAERAIDILMRRRK